MLQYDACAISRLTVTVEVLGVMHSTHDATGMSGLQYVC